jgi:hypothetical protein
MAKTYREIAIEEMLRTVEEAMSQVINWWGDLPPPMKEAIEQFRTQLGAAIDSVEFVKRALDRQVHETDRGKGPAAVHESGYGTKRMWRDVCLFVRFWGEADVCGPLALQGSVVNDPLRS